MGRLERISPLAITVLFVVIWLSFSAPAASAKEINLNQLDAVVQTCIKLIQNGDYRGAALLYHYPQDYSEDELRADLDGVTGSLNIFAEEFGSFTKVSPLSEAKLYVNIFASAGTHEYWEKQPHALKIEMETEFKNFGPGFLIIQLVDIVGLLEVKAIAFGLPVSGDSVAKIKQVGDRMVLLNRQLSAKENKM